MLDTTSIPDDSLIPMISPLSGKIYGYRTQLEMKTELERLEQVRVACVEEYSSNPLHQARAAKDPNYWNSFSIGQHNSFKTKTD